MRKSKKDNAIHLILKCFRLKENQVKLIKIIYLFEATSDHKWLLYWHKCWIFERFGLSLIPLIIEKLKFNWCDYFCRVYIKLQNIFYIFWIFSVVRNFCCMSVDGQCSDCCCSSIGDPRGSHWCQGNAFETYIIPWSFAINLHLNIHN